MRPPRSTKLGFQPPAIGEEEIAAVVETLRSGWLTTGPRAALLEERMAEYLEAEHVLAVTSGTAALHLALLALGVGPGDEVITSPITWPATANVIEHCGATPVFCDVRDGDLNIDPALIPALVTERTKAIMPVHLAGQPADLDPILALGLPVIEDAAHAAESRYRGRKVGGISDAACFSLYATKNIAAGEGGLVATNSDDIAGGDQEHAPHAARRRVALRPGHGRASRRTSRTCSRRSRSSSSTASTRTRRSGSASSRSTTRGSRGSTGITPLERDPRDTHALHLYVGADRRRPARARTRDAYQHALGDELIGTSIHFLPVHRLTWFRERYPDQPRAAGRRARRRRGAVAAALAGALGRRHPRRRRRRPPRARAVHVMRAPKVPRLSHVKRPLRILIGVAFTTLAVALHPAQDRHPPDVGGPQVGQPLVVRARRRDHDRDGAADGAALAVAARGAGDDRPLLVADARVLRLVHGRPDPADLDRRRRGADLRDRRSGTRAGRAT